MLASKACISMSNSAPQTFEEKLARIDAIVKELESGNVDLDRSLALFEEGKTLVRACEAQLKDAQEKIKRAMTPGADHGAP